MLDLEKLRSALTERSSKAKDLAKQYRGIDDTETANRYDTQASVYDEIKHDIDKGKFKEKKKS